MHSIGGVILALALETIILMLIREASLVAGIILAFSIAGAVGIIVVSTEVIREVKNADHMLFLLTAVIAEFILFFTFQYGFFITALPGSFQGLSLDPTSLFLHSTMIFALNPLYMPVNAFAKALLLINTLGSLAIVLFVLQNVWQFRSPTASHDHL